jgi:Na+-transporting NADH:ubiquinone oxidoreductase subunit C
MNKNSNTYTFLYAAGLVVVVAAALAIASMSLKGIQQKNIEIEKKQNILMSVNKTDGLATASGKNEFIETHYKKYIVEEYIVGSDGQRKEGAAFLVDMKEQYELIKAIKAAKTTDAQKAALRARLQLPVFVCQNDDGALKYIVPVYGLGLWGAIWGYVSFDNDFNTIYGATFDHKGETPGLGAEIATLPFSRQFAGKQITDQGRFASIRVVKGGTPPHSRHSVDAVSGGTITSRGVEDMLKDCLGEYEPFFEQQRTRAIPQETLPENIETLSENIDEMP